MKIRAKYYRQTILLSPYETPEMRSLFNTTLTNLGGKIRTMAFWQPVQVPQGIAQVGRYLIISRYNDSHNFQTFVSFDCASLTSEADKRFEHFSTKVFFFFQIFRSEVTNVYVASTLCSQVSGSKCKYCYLCAVVI